MGTAGPDRALSTRALRRRIGRKDWWRAIPQEWRRSADGRWRRRERVGRTVRRRTAKEREEGRPIVIVREARTWNLEAFLQARRRAGRTAAVGDDRGSTEKGGQDGSQRPEATVVALGRGEKDREYRNRLYRARRQCTHVVVAVAAEDALGRHSKRYLDACQGRKETPQSSGAEDALAEAFRRRGTAVEQQATVGRYRPDFLLRGARGDTAVEVDGWYWHREADGRRKAGDVWRDEVLAAAGVRTVRLDAAEVARDPDAAAEMAIQRHGDQGEDDD